MLNLKKIWSSFSSVHLFSWVGNGQVLLFDEGTVRSTSAILNRWVGNASLDKTVRLAGKKR